jgi:hypothetical protein
LFQGSFVLPWVSMRITLLVLLILLWGPIGRGDYHPSALVPISFQEEAAPYFVRFKITEL